MASDLIKTKLVKIFLNPISAFIYIEKGKGLGLYMIKLQIESMGGTVHVRSEENKDFYALYPFNQAWGL